VVLGLVALVVVPLVVGAGWFWFQVQPRGAQGAAVTIEVGEGWTLHRTAGVLAAEGVVGSGQAFEWWAAISGVGDPEAGRYTFHKNMGGRAAGNVLKVGPEVQAAPDLTLLVPPGLTVGEVADRVGQLPGHSRDGFLAAVNSGAIRSRYMPPEVTSLEGFLFPDTYRIAAADDDAAVARRLVAQFDAVADRVGLANAPAANGRTPYETVVVASLIQDEAKLAEDAPLISAVIRNRLRDRMPLQIDATLCYAKGGCPPVPTEADKSINSPYNTYKIAALPPTPIANVTEANLNAALHPADVTYKYYVLSDANGKHAFADTLAQHEANIRAARAKGVL